ncbi:response regulator transcription factor [Ktedonobacter racemifer]|uniref:Two component transcriptional regulator, winged helix family n=1 Tax=Ktedonobacter racemifer DSM 44963 TaxID=485913 RepID=D6U8J0_KTERA|nr:response regulator transcription factor [Ktedonobacter racemifer]EFH80201.1 two component transcriptional regulator, winged helix family [Ktedonobacter racemifer DSM 44963]
MKYKILVVDDDKKTVDLIRLSLKNEHFETLEAYDGIEALALTRSEAPDLIILDWMLPHVGGLDLCRIVRLESTIPVIMLTAKATEDDKLLGLNLGVDDYLTKPFSLRELVARVRVVLRRTYRSEERPATLHFSDLVINVQRHEVWLSGKAIRLTPKEFKLLETFVRNPGRIFSREELVERVCGSNYDGFDRAIDFHLGNLRKKIDTHSEQPSYIQTVHGVGYTLRRANDVA